MGNVTVTPVCHLTVLYTAFNELPVAVVVGVGVVVVVVVAVVVVTGVVTTLVVVPELVDAVVSVPPPPQAASKQADDKSERCLIKGFIKGFMANLLSVKD